MPFSFETFAWAVSALFQLLTVCAYLLSFPDVDGVDDQLPDMPEVIQDSAIETKITYSGIIFVFGFYTQVVVVKQSWNWWRKKMEEPDNSLMVMVGPQRSRRAWNGVDGGFGRCFGGESYRNRRRPRAVGCEQRGTSAEVDAIPLLWRCAKNGLELETRCSGPFRSGARQGGAAADPADADGAASEAPARARRRRESFRSLAHWSIFTQVLDTVDRWVKHVSKEATFPADYVNALVVIARRRKALEGGD